MKNIIQSLYEQWKIWCGAMLHPLWQVVGLFIWILTSGQRKTWSNLLKAVQGLYKRDEVLQPLCEVGELPQRLHSQSSVMSSGVGFSSIGWISPILQHCDQKGPYYRDRVPTGTFLAIWIPTGSLFICQGPYFQCFGFIHAKNVNSVLQQ